VCVHSALPDLGMISPSRALVSVTTLGAMWFGFLLFIGGGGYFGLADGKRGPGGSDREREREQEHHSLARTGKPTFGGCTREICETAIL